MGFKVKEKCQGVSPLEVSLNIIYLKMGGWGGVNNNNKNLRIYYLIKTNVCITV